MCPSTDLAGVMKKALIAHIPHGESSVCSNLNLAVFKLFVGSAAGLCPYLSLIEGASKMSSKSFLLPLL